MHLLHEIFMFKIVCHHFQLGIIPLLKQERGYLFLFHKHMPIDPYHFQGLGIVFFFSFKETLFTNIRCLLDTIRCFYDQGNKSFFLLIHQQSTEFFLM